MTKQYDAKFKLDAIQYRKDHPDLSVAATCRNLGISQPTYYQWQKELRSKDEINKDRGSGNYGSDLEKENALLRRELQAQKDALRILKKAISILGEEPK